MPIEYLLNLHFQNKGGTLVASIQVKKLKEELSYGWCKSLSHEIHR